MHRDISVCCGCILGCLGAFHSAQGHFITHRCLFLCTAGLHSVPCNSQEPSSGMSSTSGAPMGSQQSEKWHLKFLEKPALGSLCGPARRCPFRVLWQGTCDDDKCIQGEFFFFFFSFPFFFSLSPHIIL